MDDQLKYDRARKRVAEIKGFYIHALVFALVVSGLAALNLALGKPYWVLWVLLGWGLGLLLHAAIVFSGELSFLSDWEARKMKQLLERDEARNVASDQTRRPAS